MSIRVECPNPQCRKSLEAPDTHAGKKARCPGCGHIITIPDPETVLVEAADPLIGARLGVLEIKEKLGQGGMGAVYLGTNTTLDRLVAVKVLPEDLIKDNPTFLDRFLREAKMAAKLNHPNAVIVYSVGEAEGRHFIEMEFVQGMNLRQVIQKQGKVELMEASRIIADAAKALAAAHEQGIVHRDIKPDNIMLTEKGQVKVADFGLARISTADSSITMSGQVMGTPLYMSPEQGHGKQTDGRTDIYSLGATYYHALVGKVPFTGDTPLQVMMKHANDPIPWPEGAEEIPPEIRQIIEKMMAKEPDDRYAICEQLIGEIEEYFKPKPVMGRAVTVATPIQQAISIAAPPKNAYVLSAQDLAAIESAGREFRHPTPPKPKPKPAEPKAARPMPRWLLPAIGVVVLVIVAAVVIGIVSKRRKRLATDQHGLTRIEEQKPDRDSGVVPRDSKHKPQAPIPEPRAPVPEYVTEAASGEKIPHPLSRKILPTVLPDRSLIYIPEGMVYVPAGTFLMGDNKNSPYTGFVQTEVYLDACFVDKYEVTNAQYMEFVKATNHAPPLHWKGGRIPRDQENHPIVFVSWNDAKAYCDWCGKRLPTEAEWEKAASWDLEKKQKRRFPWGNEYESGRANDCHAWGCRCDKDFAKHQAWESTVGNGMRLHSPVGKFTGDMSFFGCYDMGGSVFEWVGDWYKADYYKVAPHRNPQGPTEHEADQRGDLGKCRVRRGGHCANYPDAVLTFVRQCMMPKHVGIHDGFRCALSASDLEKWKKGETTKVTKKEEPPATAAPTPEASRYDEKYVAEAATGDKIAHPLSRKTYKVRYQGEIYEVPEGMVFVPAGEFLMGSRKDPAEADEGPEHEVYLDAYFIDKFEITNAQYMEFVKATGHRMPWHWYKEGGKFPEAKANHPVMAVSWEDAAAYCDWVGKRLPSEAEWEKAASWDMPRKNRRVYPWGNEYLPNLANHADYWKALSESENGREVALKQRGTSTVGQFKEDLSALGCFDMAGNVSEWVADWYRHDYYQVSPNKNPKGPTEAEASVVEAQGIEQRKRVFRGSGWDWSSWRLRCSCRPRHLPSQRLIDLGFRCALSAADLEKWKVGATTKLTTGTKGGEDASRRGAESADKKKDESQSQIQNQQSKIQNHDGVYVTTAATKEAIPHPLSNRTEPIECDGKVVRVPEGMVYVHEGTFVMGEGESKHEVYLDAYFIGKYEVTNAEWKAFTDSTGFNPLPNNWQDGKIPDGKENHPVAFVSWEDAHKYCEWIRSVTGRDVRLPTEAEWEKAATWDPNKKEKRTYPWGSQWDPLLCNSGYLLAKFGFRPDESNWWKCLEEFAKTNGGKKSEQSGGNAMAVGTFPKGASPYGCLDMAGNVFEWCNDWFSKDYYKSKDAKKNPQGPSEAEAEGVAGGKKGRVVRGGGWFHASFHCAGTYRFRNDPTTRTGEYGFRVAQSAKPSR